eukprot:scaffold7489_cov96-Cylindrotheca_fusiformis.AAC.3
MSRDGQKHSSDDWIGSQGLVLIVVVNHAIHHEEILADIDIVLGKRNQKLVRTQIQFHFPTASVHHHFDFNPGTQCEVWSVRCWFCDGKCAYIVVCLSQKSSSVRRTKAEPLEVRKGAKYRLYTSNTPSPSPLELSSGPGGQEEKPPISGLQHLLI